jgi:hypothetical protein
LNTRIGEGGMGEVRLEQERIGFRWVREALARLGEPGLGAGG